jgi:hypothetical protein
MSFNRRTNGIANGNTYSPSRDDGNENWVKVQKIHYRLVPDPPYLLHILQRRYGRGNFYVEVGGQYPLCLLCRELHT